MEKADGMIRELIDKMPRVSGVTIGLLNRLMDESITVSEIVRLIEPDVSLSARCLQMVNSPYFGLSRKVTSIRLAVNFFGRLNLLSLILRESFSNIFSVSMAAYDHYPGEFWHHSLRTAVAAKVTAEHLASGINTDLVYTAGLLHDVGKVVISQYIDKFYPDLTTALHCHNPKNRVEIEDFILQFNHTLTGEKMAEKWRLPEPIQQTIRYHHQPCDCLSSFKRVVALVSLANQLANCDPSEFDPTQFIPFLKPDISSFFPLEKCDWNKVMDEIESQFTDMKNRTNSAYQ